MKVRNVVLGAGFLYFFGVPLINLALEVGEAWKDLWEEVKEVLAERAEEEVKNAESSVDDN